MLSRRSGGGNRRNRSNGCGVGLRVQPLHLGFDPGLHLAHQLVGLAAHAGDGFANRHVDNPRPFDEGLAGPDAGRGHGNRNHGHSRADGQARAAALVLPHLAALDARALGKHDDPGAPRQQRPALLHHLDEGTRALATVDVDHVQAANRPAEKRHTQQLFLEHIGQRVRHDRGHQKGLVGGLVLDQQHGAVVLPLRQIFHADHPGLDAHNHPR